MNDIEKKEWMLENKVQGLLSAPRIQPLHPRIGYYVKVDNFDIPKEIFEEEYQKIIEAYNSVLNKLKNYENR